MSHQVVAQKRKLKSLLHNVLIAFPRAAAFGYLDTIRQRFESAYGSSVAANVIPFAMNNDFSSVMAAETKRSNGVVAAANGSAGGSASEDKIERMKDAVEEVKQVRLQSYPCPSYRIVEFQYIFRGGIWQVQEERLTFPTH